MKKDPNFPSGCVRVTSVLQAYSTLGGIHPKTLENAADRGTRVHALCEIHALGLFVTHVDEDCKNYFEVYKRWFDEMVVEVLHVEVPLYSDQYRFCTHGVDLIAVLKGDDFPSIIDLKTPENPSLSWELQTAAYDILVEEKLGIRARRRICLMLPKRDDKVKVVEHGNHEKGRGLFLKALELYRFFNG